MKPLTIALLSFITIGCSNKQPSNERNNNHSTNNNPISLDKTIRNTRVALIHIGTGKATFSKDGSRTTSSPIFAPTLSVIFLVEFMGNNKINGITGRLSDQPILTDSTNSISNAPADIPQGTHIELYEFNDFDQPFYTIPNPINNKRAFIISQTVTCSNRPVIPLKISITAGSNNELDDFIFEIK